MAWARTGARNDRIAEAVRTASSSYRLLRANYGREAVRRRQGGALTDAERQQFQRLQGAEQRFAASLQALRDKARQRGDATTAAELERFRAEAESLAVAAADLSTYLNALIATSELRGEWHANAPYIRKAAPPAEFAAADETVQDLYVDSDIGQVFTVDLGAVPADGAAEGAETAGAAGGGRGLPGLLRGLRPRRPGAVVEPIDDTSETAEAVRSGASRPSRWSETRAGRERPQPVAAIEPAEAAAEALRPDAGIRSQEKPLRSRRSAPRSPSHRLRSPPRPPVSAGWTGDQQEVFQRWDF